MRWMDTARDFPAVYEIERCCHEFPWTPDEFQRCLAHRKVVGKVAEIPTRNGTAIVGYLVYEVHRRFLHLLNMGVHPWMRRQGVGTQLVKSMVSRSEIRLTIRERNLDGQLFFRSLGFRATAIVDQPFEETDEDAYSMTCGDGGRHLRLDCRANGG